MNFVQNVCLRSIGGALVGAGLTTIASLSTTARQQSQGALIGAVSASASTILRPIIAKVGTQFNLNDRNIVVMDVAAQGLVSSVALAAFHSADLLNTPTSALFSLLASIEPLYVLCDF